MILVHLVFPLSFHGPQQRLARVLAAAQESLGLTPLLLKATAAMIIKATAAAVQAAAVVVVHLNRRLVLWA